MLGGSGSGSLVRPQSKCQPGWPLFDKFTETTGSASKMAPLTELLAGSLRYSLATGGKTWLLPMRTFLQGTQVSSPNVSQLRPLYPKPLGSSLIPSKCQGYNKQKRKTSLHVFLFSPSQPSQNKK